MDGESPNLPISSPTPDKPNRWYLWLNLAGILFLSILLITLFLGYQKVTKFDVSQIDSNPSVETTATSTPERLGSRPAQVYYYTNDYLDGYSGFKFYTVSTDYEVSDTLTHSFSIPGTDVSVITNSGQAGVILFVANNETSGAEIWSLDVTVPHTEPKLLYALSPEQNEVSAINDARLLDGGQALAYVVHNILINSARAQNSTLHIVSLADQSKREQYALNNESPLYAGFHFLSVTPDNRMIYLDETGGDGGLIWSSWYVVNRDTGVFQKLDQLPPIAKGEENPTEFAFSPDQTRLVYADFPMAVDASDFNQDYTKANEYLYKCLSFQPELLEKYRALGGTIVLRDLKTGSNTEIFRNLTYRNNYCKNVATRIITLKWLDDKRIVFETIDGVYTLDVHTKEKQPLFIFERTRNPGDQMRSELVSVKLPLLMFSDRSIVNISSHKNIKSVAPEVEDARLFSF